MPFIAATLRDLLRALDIPFEDELQHNMYNKDFK
ncbi:hypothetical protein T11_17802 [Trichinella zimbabwensis]|uniref:Uncharacterized protein n=1 Tax=Trichinella zimbabwensis TaxID=268475 RepID=A0A0V1DRN6_9BILA|nr:hypothetical protein T11_13928 [Trichinella zimbabwensis]KRY94229.1 hypothetical protein T11_17802 [Trichinella zimbabwensis]